MSNIQPCSITSDVNRVCAGLGLHLKPTAALTITIQLPPLKTAGQAFSNWEVMEKLKALIVPQEFQLLKVTKATMEFLRFEAEIASKELLKGILTHLDGKLLKVAGITEPLKIKAAEAKVSFPSRNEWDTFFREAKNMNEMKPGERPDTIHIDGLPIRWFLNRPHETPPPQSAKMGPNGYVVKEFFETWGEIRVVDIPSNDPFRSKMNPAISGIKDQMSATAAQSAATFDAYIQYREYIGFVKAMTALRGMKLVYQEPNGGRHWACSVDVDFDRTRHLSDALIRKRRMERERLIALERDREEREKKEQDLASLRAEREQKEKTKHSEEKKVEKLERKRERLEKKKKREEMKMQQQLLRLKLDEEKALSVRIAVEERKLLVTQRKLEGIRLLDVLLDRVKRMKEKMQVGDLERDVFATAEEERMRRLLCERRERSEEERKRRELQRQERELRMKLVRNFKMRQEQHMEEQREKLSRALKEKEIQLKSVLASHSTAGAGHDLLQTSSLSEISSSENSDDESSSAESQKDEKSKDSSLDSAGVAPDTVEAHGIGHVIAAPPPPMMDVMRPPFWAGGAGGLWRGPRVGSHWNYPPRYGPPGMMPGQIHPRFGLNPQKPLIPQRLRKKFIDLDYQRRKDYKRALKGREGSGSSSSSSSDSDSDDVIRGRSLPVGIPPPFNPFMPPPMFPHVGFYGVPRGQGPRPFFQPGIMGRSGYHQPRQGNRKKKNKMDKDMLKKPTLEGYPRHHINPAVQQLLKEKEKAGWIQYPKKYSGRNTFTGSSTSSSDSDYSDDDYDHRKKKSRRSRSRSRSTYSSSRSRSPVEVKKGSKRKRSFRSASSSEYEKKKKKSKKAGGKKDNKKKKNKQKKQNKRSKKGIGDSERKVTLVKRNYGEEEGEG